MVTSADSFPWVKALLVWTALTAVLFVLLSASSPTATGSATSPPTTVTQTQLTVTVEDRVWPAVTITAVVPLQHRVEYGDDVTDEHIPGSFSVRSTNTIVWFYELPTSGDSVEYERITQTIYGITDGGDGDTLDAYRDMFNQLDIWIARATSTRPSTITVTGQLEAVWEIGSLRADTTND